MHQSVQRFNYILLSDKDLVLIMGCAVAYWDQNILQSAIYAIASSCESSVKY